MSDMAEDATNTECPVCCEDFTDPKLLNCNHLVCYKCIVKWLNKSGKDAGCPLCLEPIISPAEAGQDDLSSLVDDLPTHRIVADLVKGNNVLSSRHECMHCDPGIAASFFCLQCNMKLCQICARRHKNIPALKKHVIEDLNDLTPERLAENNRTMCKNHDDKQVELYCTTHEKLICLLCYKNDHRACKEIKDITEAAAEMREEFKLTVQKLKDKETEMRKEIKKLTDKFTSMRQEANVVFDDLEQHLKTRRQEVENMIQAEEQKVNVSQLDKDRAAIGSHATVIDDLLRFGSDDGVLDMTSKMKARLMDLQQQTMQTMITDLLCLVFDSRKLTQIKTGIDSVGQVGESEPKAKPAVVPPVGRKKTPVSTQGKSVASKPSDSEASVSRSLGHASSTALKVGDAVMRGQHWTSGNEDGGGRGTVTAVPSKIRASRGCEPEGFVDVRWNNGCEQCYRMGRYNHFDLVKV